MKTTYIKPTYYLNYCTKQTILNKFDARKLFHRL